MNEDLLNLLKKHEPESILKKKRASHMRSYIKEDRKVNITPTVKQIKAVQYLAQGLSTAESLRKAGYSRSIVRTSTGYMKSPGIQVLLTSMSRHLTEQGLGEEKVAGKIAELIDAKKADKDAPDYQVQIQGIKLWKEFTDKDREMQGGAGTKKRELTLTEWITGNQQGEEKDNG